MIRKMGNLWPDYVICDYYRRLDDFSIIVIYITPIFLLINILQSKMSRILQKLKIKIIKILEEKR